MPGPHYPPAVYNQPFTPNAGYPVQHHMLVVTCHPAKPATATNTVPILIGTVRTPANTNARNNANTADDGSTTEDDPDLSPIQHDFPDISFEEATRLVDSPPENNSTISASAAALATCHVHGTQPPPGDATSHTASAIAAASSYVDVEWERAPPPATVPLAAQPSIPPKPSQTETVAKLRKQISRLSAKLPGLYNRQRELQELVDIHDDAAERVAKDANNGSLPANFRHPKNPNIHPFLRSVEATIHRIGNKKNELYLQICRIERTGPFAPSRRSMYSRRTTLKPPISSPSAPSASSKQLPVPVALRVERDCFFLFALGINSANNPKCQQIN